MPKYIDADALGIGKANREVFNVPEYADGKKDEAMNKCDNCKCNKVCDHNKFGFENCDNYISEDCAEVVYCKDCIYARELDKNCELNREYYKHCALWRGDETKNVWHKYKKYYKDYSLVEAWGYCSDGERKGGKE